MRSLQGSTYHHGIILRVSAQNPAEDAVFSVMFKNGVSDRKFRDDVNTLMKDHSEIEGIIRETIEAVDTMLVDPHPDFTDIGNKLSTLINRQRSHLLIEEMNVYPQLAEHLDNKDWENIATLIPDHEDPLFGGEVKKEYELIFKAF